MDESLLLLLIGGILAASILIAQGASRVGVSSLVAFLVIGMLLGSQGIGGIEFSDAHLARSVGVIALILILFEGGLSTSWRRLRHVAWSATSLSIIGVGITALLTGIAARYIFHLPWLESLLLGSVVSSTDAAAVFATLRFTNIKLRVARVLEAETGGNDPMAIALTLGLLAWIGHADYHMGNLVLLLVHQLGIGVVVGVALGAAATYVFSRLPQSIGAFAPVASLAVCALSYGIAGVLGGSGFLAVYLVGLAVGSTPSPYRRQLVNFHEGIAFLSQVILFIVLGLLVFPKDLVPVAPRSLILALLLIILIRPVAVFISMMFSRFSIKERVLIGYAGLRGAVPIVLGTFVLTSPIAAKSTIFNIVFFVVLASALIQGATLERVARWLGLTEAYDAHHHLAEPVVQIVLEHQVTARDSINGVKVSEVGLPRHATIATIKRGAEDITPNSRSDIRVDDILYVITTNHQRAAAEDVIARWRRRV